MKALILDNKYIWDGHFGLERETLRVTSDGRLAKTPHPFPSSKNLDRDFCENQLELITPVSGSIDGMFQILSDIDKSVKKTLEKNGEYLWLNSNPPHIETESDITVARFFGEKSFKRDYRLNLERRYGKRLMLYSGIHFNFSFTDEFLNSVYDGKTAFIDFKTSLYFRLHKYLCRYSWLIVMLSAASPVYDLSLDGDYLTGDGFDGFASRRNGEKGYWNKFLPVLDYTDMHTYIESIKQYIKDGALFSAAELYLPVRIKPRGANTLDSLLSGGIDHIELRMFDLNPLSPVGIMREDLEFAHYFIIYLLSLPEFEFTPDLQTLAIKNHREAALYEPETINGYNAKDAALGLLEDIRLFYKGTAAEENIALQIKKIKENKRWCVEVYNRYRENFHEKTLLLAKSGGTVNI